MTKRFNKLCSLLLTFAVTATTVFSSDISMVAAYADDAVESVAVEAEAEVPADEAVEAADDEAVVTADNTEEAVADGTEATVTEGTEAEDEDAAVAEEIEDEDAEVEELEGADYEHQTEKTTGIVKMSGLKVVSVSGNDLDDDDEIDEYIVKVSYKAETVPASGFFYDNEDWTVGNAFTIVGTATKEAATLGIDKTDVNSAGWVYFADTDSSEIAAAVVFDIDSSRYGSDDNKTDLEKNRATASENKGLIVTYNKNDEIDGWYGIWKKGKYTYTDYAGKIAEVKADYYYTGKPIKPSVLVYDGDAQLTEGVDYTVKYKNNTNPTVGKMIDWSVPGASFDAENHADAPAVIVSFKGTYAGNASITKNFNIVPTDIDDCAWGNTETTYSKSRECDCPTKVHAEADVKKEPVIKKNDTPVSPKVDVTIYSSLTRKDKYKDGVHHLYSYKAVATKLSNKGGDNADYFVKYISYNGWYDAASDTDAWLSKDAVTEISAPGHYVVLVSGNKAVGKLKDSAMSADEFYYVDKDHNVATAKITVSTNASISYNVIANGYYDYDNNTSKDAWYLDPASIQSLKIGKTVITDVNELKKFAFYIYADSDPYFDRSVGKNRRLNVEPLAEAQKEGYYGKGIGCKTKYEITADKNLDALEAMIYNPNTNKLQAIEDFKYSDITMQNLGTYARYLVLLDKENKTYLTRKAGNAVCPSLIIDGVTYNELESLRDNSKANTKYVGNGKFVFEAYGIGGYAGTKNVTIKVVPFEVSANNISKEQAGYEYMNLGSDGQSIYYQPITSVVDAQGNPVKGVYYRPSQTYADIFDGTLFAKYTYTNATMEMAKRDYSLAAPKIKTLITPWDAYDVKINLKSKGVNAGNKVTGEFVYSGAVTGKIPVSFDLVTGVYSLYHSGDIAVSTSADAVYKAGAFDNKIYGQAYDKFCKQTNRGSGSIATLGATTTGFKVKKGHLERQYKYFKLKDGTDMDVNPTRFKSFAYDEKGIVPEGKKTYADGENILGAVLFATSAGKGNFAGSYPYTYYKVGIDINRYKADISKYLKEAVEEYNTSVGSDDKTNIQIGQKCDTSFADREVNKGPVFDKFSKVFKENTGDLPAITVGKDYKIYSYSGYNSKTKSYYGTPGVTGKNFVLFTTYSADYRWDSTAQEYVGKDTGILVKYNVQTVTVDKRKDAKVDDYKYVLSK